MVQSGEASEAVALLEAAPRIYFKDESYQSVYSQCRQSLDRANFVRTAAEQITKCLAEEDIGSAQSVLDQALKPYPDEPKLLALQNRLQEEELRLLREQHLRLLEEAQVALGRMEYTRANELLTSVEQQSARLPELAARAKALLDETERRKSAGGSPQLDLRVPVRPRASRPQAISTATAAKTKTPRIATWVASGTVALVVASFGTWYLKARNVPGYLQLNATPWGQVTDVTAANGKHLHITGETPLQVQLPPGFYDVELKQGRVTGKVQVTVERGKVSVCNYTFPEVKIHDLVQTLVSAY